jgi:phospho-N-acetylmuramoyl-pentapeptide-transferase
MNESAIELLISFGKSFVVALIASGIVAYPLYRLLLAVKSRQIVSQYLPEHQKKQGTPTMGGLIVLTGVAPCIWMFEPTDMKGATLALLMGFALVGFLDDFLVPKLWPGKRGLGWIPKLLLQFLSVGVSYFVAVKYGLREITPLSIAIPYYTFVSAITVFYANAFNFTDGLDGLAGFVGLALIAGLLAVGIVNESLPELGNVLGALFGGLLVFLVLNRHPAKLFMGDVGSLPIGALLGMIAFELMPFARIHARYADEFASDASWGIVWNGYQLAAFLLISGVMLLELVPVPLQILSVKLRKKRLFSMTPVHHALESKGWRETKIVWAFTFAQLGLSSLAVFLAWIGHSRGSQ